MRFETKAIHTGVNKDTAYNSVMTPIYQTSTFRFADIGTTRGYDYTRTSNPTRKALEENIASLEGGAGAIAVANGMAAITVESLIDHPVSMTHASMDPKLRKEAGITDNLIRLSVGLENIDDLLDDLGDALNAILKPVS